MDSKTTSSKLKNKIEVTNIGNEPAFCALPLDYFAGKNEHLQSTGGKLPHLSIQAWGKFNVPIFPPTDDKILPQT
ncbi:MAG: hypothetical protein KDD56_05180 [Bdellovibrionales bacterium]|nr:hypothetical protein [Bdellovibrionales bacterium]